VVVFLQIEEVVLVY